MNIKDKVHNLKDLQDYKCGPSISDVVNNNPICEKHDRPMYEVTRYSEPSIYQCIDCEEEI